MTTTTQTIEIAPKWEGILPMLLAVIVDGSDAGRAEAAAELRRMAQLADLYVEAQKPELSAQVEG
jgi:hypothetical protein